ncbi:MAG TPA: putative Ig domain-containing protein, partial [Hymenobacter sp.]|nr:putative Ig domain-containing protein [Hymenobacter sp.]
LLGGPETWAQAPTNFDVVSIKRYRPLDQAVEYIAMFEVVFSGFIEDNTGRALGDSDFRLITTGTATGTFATISTNGNNAYVTVKDISGAGTLGIEYTGRTTSVYTGGETYESVDKRPTVLSITRRDDEKLWGGNAYPEYLVIFSEPVTGVDAADFSVALNNTYAGIYRVEEANGSNYPEYFDNNRLLGDFAHREGSQYIVTVGPVLGEGTLRLDVNATGTGIADVSGNNPLDGGFTAGESYYFDGVSPKVVSINRQAPATAVTSPGSVTFRVTFSEAVQGVDADDFGLVATGTVAGYSIGTIAAVSASVYDVTVDGITGEGTLGLKLWPGYSRTDLDRNSYGSFEAAVLALTRYYKIIYGGMATIYDFSSDNLSRTNPLGRFDLNSTAETYTITTAPPNTAPVASINPNQTATAGVAFSYTVLAFTDSETPDGLTYSASIIPANGLSFDPATRTVSGTPIGPVASTVTITATDGGGLSASTSFTLTTSCSELTASLSPNATQLSCTNPSITLTASPAGQTSYSFSAGASPIGGSSGNMATVSTGGTYSVTVTAANGCTASAQVTVSGDAADGLMTYYADADGDGFGNPSSLTTVCASTPPAGYVTNKLDCDDTRRLYADGDGDGFGAGPAVACGVANNTDCNDSMVMYADADGDGFGSTTKVACNGVANNTDCNDNLVQYADTDNDGFGSTTKVACNGVANNTDCDDTRKLYADGDKDGFGA